MKKIYLFLLVLLFISGCSSINRISNRKFLGKSYILESTSKDYKTSINFFEENFSGFSGVNSYFGKYEINGEKIKFSFINSTSISGTKEIVMSERKFLDTLSNINSFYFENNNLVLKTFAGEKLKFIEIKK